MRKLIMLVSSVLLSSVIVLSAYSADGCAIGSGGVTNYNGTKHDMELFISETSKNIELSLEYLGGSEYDFYSSEENKKYVFNFDNLFKEGVIEPSYREGLFLFKVGKFWNQYLPNVIGIVVQCDDNQACGLSPII